MMKTVFSTKGIHARDRFAYWHDVAERVLTGHDSRPGRRDDFSAELRAALADPLQDQRTIGEIAFSWGVGDLTNFGRMFAAAYGVTPRAYRQQRAA